MRVVVKELHYKTSRRTELINITQDVEKTIQEEGIRNGVCIIHVPHATASIIINEDEEGLKNDIVKWLSENIPWNAPWKHNTIDNNAAAHIAASILGNARLIPITNGRLNRGTWQDIFLVELDGPRSLRRVIVQLIGD